MKSNRLFIIIIFTVFLTAALTVFLFRLSDVSPDAEPAEHESTLSGQVPSPALSDEPAQSSDSAAAETEPCPENTETTQDINDTQDTQDIQDIKDIKDIQDITSSPDIPEPEESDGVVSICIGGDTSIDSEFADACVKWGVDYPWKEVSDIFNAADISVVNLETCVSDRGTSEKPQGYGFRTPPQMLEGFSNAGIDVVNLANNHTRDFGYDALLDTFKHLASYDIDYFGAGENIERASGLVIKQQNGVKIGFAGCNYVYLPESCAAGEDYAGINMVYKLNDERTLAFLQKVSEFDGMCDVLIVFMHCGTEESFEEGSYQKKLARALIDNGADIVVGAHPHTLQPIEFYNGKPILYSIGNLIFWHQDDDIDGLTCIFEITVDRSGFKSMRIYPLFIQHYKVYLLKDGEGKYPEKYARIIELMNSLCNENGISFDYDGNMTEYADNSIDDENTGEYVAD